MIWYLAPGVCGLGQMTLSRSAAGIIARLLMPPSLVHAIRSGSFPS